MSKDEEALVLDKNFNLIRVKFHNVNEKYFQNAKFLRTAQTWKIETKLSIITGRNGSGKSHLLNYVKNAIDDMNDRNNERKLIMRFNPYFDFQKASNLINTGAVGVESASKKVEFTAHVQSFYENKNLLGLLDNLARVFIDYTTLDRQLKCLINRVLERKLNRAEIDRLYDEFHQHKETLLDNPLEMLASKLNASYWMRSSTQNELKSNVTKLRDAYEERFGAISQSLELDFFNFAKNQKLIDEFVEDYTNEKFATVKGRINECLNNFDFRLDFDNEKVILEKKMTGSSWVRIEKPSSGELYFLNMVAMVYENCDQHFLKTDIIILDEPDRHLEPKLIEKFFKLIYDLFVQKENIQVIMTTHRPDTIALAPGDSIYIIDQDADNRTSVKRCHKLQALFRLTYNLRGITNFKTRVYVEAITDYRFYEGIYNVLFQYSSYLREQLEHLKPVLAQGNLKNSRQRFYWPNLNVKNNRILSRRYQLEFFPSPLEKNGSSGGFEQVVNSVKRDCSAYYCFSTYHNKSVSGFSTPELEKPFGIVDRDFETSNEIKYDRLEPEIKYRIERLDRYNLENYLYDPILVCSSFVSRRDFDAVFHTLKNCHLKSILSNCFDALDMYRKNSAAEIGNSLQTLVNDYFKLVVEHLLTSNLAISVLVFRHLVEQNATFAYFDNELEQKLDQVVKTFAQEHKRINLKWNTNDFYGRSDLMAIFEEEFDQKDIDMDALINILMAKTVKKEYFTLMLNLNVDENNNKINSRVEKYNLKIDYPTFLLNFNGHKIENVVEHMYRSARLDQTVQFGDKKLADHVIERLLNYDFDDKQAPKSKIFIPNSLGECFFNINFKLREQITKIIKNY